MRTWWLIGFLCFTWSCGSSRTDTSHHHDDLPLDDGRIAPQWTGSEASLRGLDAYNDHVVWATGTNGTILFTLNGGRSWHERVIHSARDLDLRDVAVLDEFNVVVMSAGVGEQSRLFHTTDGGTTWNTTWTNPRETGFLDGIAFWDQKNGLAYGDPVDGHFQILRTDDGGASWTEIPKENIPPAMDGEAGFAASGTGIAVAGENHAWICTGGVSHVRVFRTVDGGLTWDVTDTELEIPTSTTGGFSLAFYDTNYGILVGGDFMQQFNTASNCARTSDGGRTWTPVTARPPCGYRSCVSIRPGGNEAIAVGKAGIDVTRDGGVTWKQHGSGGWYCIDFSSRNVAWLAGSQGRIARWEFGPRR